MLFSSPRFLIFLAVVLALLAVRFELRTKKRILAVASCVFYAAWDYRYLALLLAVSFIDYYSAARIDASEDVRVRKAWLTFSIVSNLGILAYFKYLNFFIENLNDVLGQGTLPSFSILLPAGISFYTFKSMSYTIDVYRREIEPCRSQMDYTTFVTFFPELIAGPIVRASVFLPQMSRELGPTMNRVADGASLFILGLTKKKLIADRLAVYVDEVFAKPAMFSGPTLWLALFAYALQIYCDFAGYSDMAIGTARMIGYDLPENFNMPYISANVTEFWRRWHITLSTWLRDYLYIPLGGNRRGRGRTYLNLTITMLLGGLWHGASWNFVLWGLLHGVALAVHKFYRERVPPQFQMPRVISIPLTFLFVMLCWLPFRALDFGVTRQFLYGMLTMKAGANWIPTSLVFLAPLVFLGHALGILFGERGRGNLLLQVFGARLESNSIAGWYVRLNVSTAGGAFLVTLWLLMLLFFVEANSSPFIYFQF